MKQVVKNLPLSTVTLVFGALSIPLAFARHLVSLAVVLAFLALVFGWWGRREQAKHILRYAPVTTKRTQLGFRLGGIGMGCALLMWVLWASNVLF